MNYFEVLAESLAAKIDSGAIGSPVALRLYLQLTADHGLLLPYAAQGLDLAQRWFGAEATIDHVQGGVAQGYLTVLGRPPIGTCLVHAELQREGDDPNVRLVLVGNQGTAEFEDSPEELGQEADFSPSDLRPIVNRIEARL